MQAIDVGGIIQIHMFGAYFGLAASYILGKPSKGTEHETNIVSDILSLIGTLFLWIYWPSFSGGEQEPDSPQQQRAVVHTILALCAATLATFAVSTFLNPSHKFRPVDIQNATLAGGVAIGRTCNLTMNPIDPLIISLVALLVSSPSWRATACTTPAVSIICTVCLLSWMLWPACSSLRTRVPEAATCQLCSAIPARVASSLALSW